MFKRVSNGKLVMKAFKSLILCAALAISSVSTASEPRDLSVSHFEELQELQFSGGNAVGIQKAFPSEPAVLRFNALGQSFELQLESNERLLSSEVRDALVGGIHLYRGKIAGNPHSWVRIVMFGGQPRGLIWDGNELLAVEAPGDSAVATTTPIIYRMADMQVLPGTISCGIAASDEDIGAMYKTLLGELASSASARTSAVSQIDIGVIGDFAFTNTINGDAAAAIVTRLNNVDGIFSTQIGVQIVVQENEVFTTANDPFSATTDAATLLSELGWYRLNNANQMSQGLTHLFTGRNLDGSSVGLANIGLLCNNRFSVGLTQATLGAAMDSLIATHEIGHNFGAPHDGAPGSACEAEPSTFIMATLISNDVDQFSSCSIEQMQPVIAAAACVTPLPSADVAVSPDGSPLTTLLGNNANVNFNVTNLGTEPATNVGIDITLPNNVTFLSSVASAGTCSDGAGQVNCQLGTIVAGGTNTVMISTRSSAVGTGSFDASISADADDNPGNNRASFQVTVDPAVDLVVNAPKGDQLLLDKSIAVSVSVENAAILDATGVVLTVTLDAGLRADAVSWPIGSCSVVGQQVDCQASRFLGRTSTLLTINLTGTAAGQHSYSVVMGSAEADLDATNNNDIGTVTVSAPSGGNSGQGSGGGVESGGGAVGYVFLSLLFWALLCPPPWKRPGQRTTRPCRFAT